MFLIPPSATSRWARSIPPQQPANNTVSSTIGENLTVVGERGAADANDGAQEIVLTTATDSVATPAVGLEGVAAATVISPEKQLLHSAIAPNLGTSKDTHDKGGAAAIVSPEKGF